MSYSIPGLENYPGCKNGSGVFQKIISHIPPHETLIVPFLGHCGIVRNIKRSSTHVYMDASAKVVDAWISFLRSHTFTCRDVTGHIFENGGAISAPGYILENIGMVPVLPERIFIFNGDSCQLLQNVILDETIVVYADPPYLHSTRKDLDLYEFEMTDSQHWDLLSLFIKMCTGKKANILLSTYDNPLYAKMLKGWQKIKFQTMSRGGVRTETLYFTNGLKNGLLHDYSYLGTDYKDRERIKLKVNRWVDGLKRLDARERMAILEQVKKVV